LFVFYLLFLFIYLFFVILVIHLSFIICSSIHLFAIYLLIIYHFICEISSDHIMMFDALAVVIYWHSFSCLVFGLSEDILMERIRRCWLVTTGGAGITSRSWLDVSGRDVTMTTSFVSSTSLSSPTTRPSCMV